MNAPHTAPERVREFVNRVAEHFADLPERERAELLEDLESHLLEVASEGSDHLDAELTSPEAYAAELRRSAGLPERAPGRVERLRRLAAWPREQPSVRAVLDFLPQLRPAWWVLRAWVAVALAIWFVGGVDWWRQVPVPGGNLVGLTFFLVVAVLSVRAGLDGRDRNRPGRVADGLLGCAALLIAFGLLVSSPAAGYVPLDYGEPWQPSVLRHPDGEPITNLYLFDLDGKPLEGVLVYDGLGRPVQVGDLWSAGFGDLDTVTPRDRSGGPVSNLFPLEQYTLRFGDAGQEVREPRPLPPVVLPDLRDGAASPTPSPGVPSRGLR